MSKGLVIGSPEYKAAELRVKHIQEYRRLVERIAGIISAGDDEHGGYHVNLNAWQEIAAQCHQPYNMVYDAIVDALQQTHDSDVMIRCFIAALERLYPDSNVEDG